MAKRKRQAETADPDEARRILTDLARMLAEQPTFDLPNPLDRMLWESEQRRKPGNQRELAW